MAVALSARASRSIDLIQSELNTLREELTSTSFCFGVSFEKELFATCVSRGLNVKKQKRRGDVDLIVNGKKVQCKAKNGCTSKIKLYGGNKLSYDQNAFDVLAVRVGDKTFFVPSGALRGSQRGKLKSQLKVSAIRKWQDAWHVFDSHAHVEERTLFSHLEEDRQHGTNS